MFPLPQPGVSPAKWYAQVLHEPGYAPDPAQVLAIAALERLHHALRLFKAKRDRPFGRSLLPSPDLPRGLYFWGGVGRGKSLLMDAFYAGLPYRRKRRVHFHDFMQQVHAALHTQKNTSDPLVQVATQIAHETRVLCFDEFHVSDIADAMILGRLLEGLFAHGVVLVLTSNYAPDDLYPGALQRERFLPTIALLKERLDVMALDGGFDHRRRTLSEADTWFTPAAPAASTWEDARQTRGDRAGYDGPLAQLFTQLAAGRPLLSPELEIHGHPLTAIRHVEGLLWCDFPSLCVAPRSQNDYLWLARRYPTLLLSAIPQLLPRDESAARRFTWLIDILYDHRIKLAASAEVAADALYPAGPFAQEFTRTVSRLAEMRSHEYLATPARTTPDSITPQRAAQMAL